jgi:hypothetical protein
MSDFINNLNQPMFECFGTPMTYLEAFGFVTGVICVLLTIQKNILNFPVGIVNSALLGVLFFNNRLFAFEEALNLQNSPWVKVSGSIQERVQAAKIAIFQLKHPLETH